MDPTGIWAIIAQINIAVINKDKEQALHFQHMLINTNIIDAENIYYAASFYALIGEKTDSINMLRQAIETGYFNYHHMQIDSSFNAIRDDPEFIKAINLAKQRHQAFKKRFLND